MNGTAKDRPFLAAGSVALYFVALVDADRQPTRRLSGTFRTLAEAWDRLTWAQRRHPDARIVREVLLTEVLG